MAIDVNEMVKKASEAAKLAPEHLQEAAFNKAFEVLMSANPIDVNQKNAKLYKRKSEGVTSPSKNTERIDPSSLDSLDRTAHSEIGHDNTCLENSLRLLLAAKDELGIDGLTSPTIARILADKFRCGASRQAVTIALDKANKFVDRQKEGHSVTFRIMGPGEDYLKSLTKFPKSKGQKS